MPSSDRNSSRIKWQAYDLRTHSRVSRNRFLGTLCRAVLLQAISTLRNATRSALGAQNLDRQNGRQSWRALVILKDPADENHCFVDKSQGHRQRAEAYRFQNYRASPFFRHMQAPRRDHEGGAGKILAIRGYLM
jgi:hypothetical protein